LEIAEVNTISWLPANLNVRPLALRPEVGANYDLATTIQAMSATGQRITYWGPFEIDSKFHQRFLEHKTKLEGGSVFYKAVDSIYAPQDGTVSNCIHAVSDLDRDHDRGYYSELSRIGEAASEFIVISLAQGKQIDAQLPQPWLAEHIGLTASPPPANGTAKPLPK